MQRNLTFPQAFEVIKRNSAGNPLETYLSVCERFPPVMHHFFTGQLIYIRDAFSWPNHSSVKRMSLGTPSFLRNIM
jgi:hypothetical protein